MAEFDELIKETKREIRVFLRNPDVRPDDMKYDQLRDVQSEICRMARIRDPEKFFPYYPKGMAVDTCQNDSFTCVRNFSAIGVKVWYLFQIR